MQAREIHNAVAPLLAAMGAPDTVHMISCGMDDAPDAATLSASLSFACCAMAVAPCVSSYTQAIKSLASKSTDVKHFQCLFDLMAGVARAWDSC